MAPKVPGIEFIRLWPSVFLETDLPDYETPTRRLIELAGTHAGDAVFAIDDPCVEWLKGHLSGAISAYLQHTDYAKAPTWGARARFETRRRGDYRALANQPGADLAGMYVLQWPAEQGPSQGRDDGLPGTVSFYDPRIGMNMNAIRRDPYHGYHQHLVPRAGLLVIWPAYVSYFMHPNRSDEAAMRVAFDVRLRTSPEAGG